MAFAWRQAVVVGMSGLLLGGVLSATAQEGAETPTPDAPAAEAPMKMRGHKRHFGGPALRSEAVVPVPDGEGYQTVRMDSGTLESVDGDTLTIAEADGTKVEIPVGEDTVVRRDHEEAAVGDLVVGDHVKAIRVRPDGGETTTKAVMALSAERFTELEERRADGHRQGRLGRGFGPGRTPADVEPAAEPASV